MANCMICGDPLSFFDKNKACPKCAEAFKEMTTTDNRDIAMPICEQFKVYLPQITDEGTKALLEEGIKKVEETFKPEPPLMHTTTNGFEGYAIKEYFGVVVAKAVFDSGKAQTLERMQDAKPSFSQFDRQARKLGANAVVGMRVEYSLVVSDQSGMWCKVMETVTGTAVFVEPVHERIRLGEQYD
ncbi:MAG: heavy metal-binding domain-containing protein [Oxalobacter sp.]|nr:heavy metal-binding domain-containing protein [Oxalobacter sp.]